MVMCKMVNVLVTLSSPQGMSTRGTDAAARPTSLNLRDLYELAIT
jgi:hypothetical protein